MLYKQNTTVSLLMTTYWGERASLLEGSLEMTFRQSRPPDQIVLVLDGALGQDQEQVILRYQHDPRIANLKVIRLPKNVGLAAALAMGAKYCTSDWIMRMDSDDESTIERTELQIAYALEHPEVDLIGTWAEEYTDSDSNIRIKSSPITHDALVRGLKWRNLICHPSVMMRASSLHAVGGYRSTYPLLEDWDLFVRFVTSGARIAVIPKVLVRVRTSTEQAARRGGIRYVLHEARFRTFLLTSGFINFRQFAASTTAYIAFRLASPKLRGLLYNFTRRQAMAKSDRSAVSQIY
jgi:glycosyltransferase involved in cell wall biosynthesis